MYEFFLTGTGYLKFKIPQDFFSRPSKSPYIFITGYLFQNSSHPVNEIDSFCDKAT